MMLPVEDRRVRRTKRLLKDAFLSLLQYRAIEEVTVTELIETADYNRSTFYRHYEDLNTFIDELFTDEVSQLIDAFKAPYIRHGTVHLTNLSPHDILLFDHIQTRRAFYTQWTKLKTHDRFKSIFLHEIQTFYANEILIDLPTSMPLDRQLYTTFYAYGIYGLISEWIDNDFLQSTHMMAEQLCYIMTYLPDKTSLLTTN